MLPRMVKTFFVSVMSACMVLALGLPAASEEDHDRARAAVEAGEVAPLPRILAVIERDYPGQILEVELEREHGRWIYEIKLLAEGGRMLKLEVDARTAEVLKAIGKGAGRHGRERG